MLVYKVTTVYITGNAFLWNVEGRIPVLKKSWLFPWKCIAKHRFPNSVPCGNRLFPHSPNSHVQPTQLWKLSWFISNLCFTFAQVSFPCCLHISALPHRTVPKGWEASFYTLWWTRLYFTTNYICFLYLCLFQVLQFAWANGYQLRLRIRYY